MKAAHTPRLNWLAAATLAVALVACPDQQTPPPAPDTTPDAVSFAPVTGAELSAITESNQVTISGINTAAAVSVSGGEYRIGNAGSYTATPGTINAGDKLQLRTTAAPTLNTTKDVQVTIGTSNFSFSVTTKTTPGDVSFATKIDQPWGTAVESNTVTLSSINPGTAISVSGAGGSYKINNGAYTSAAGTVNSGDTVTVKGNTASADLTDTVVTLTIGAQARSFTIRTGKRIPDGFNPVLSNQTNATPGSSVSETFTVSGITIASPITVTGGTFTVNGSARTSPSILNNNDVVVVTTTAPNAADGSSSAPVTVTIGRDNLNPSGGLAGSFTVSTVDWIPNAFTLTLDGTQTNVDGTGKVVPSQYLAERIWTGQGRYTLPGCTTPAGDDRYLCPRFPPTATSNGGNSILENIDRLRYYDANAVTVNSISPNTPISITGGRYKINNSAYTASAGTINPGDSLSVQTQAGAYPGVTTTAVVSFGTASFVTTRSLGITTNATAINLSPDTAKFGTDTIKSFWTQNALTTPGIVPDSSQFGQAGAALTTSISVPSTTATLKKVRVLVTLNGASVRPSDFVIKLIAPDNTSYTLMDFVNAKPAGSGLIAGRNPLDPREAGTARPAPVTVPLAPPTGDQPQLPFPWWNPFDPTNLTGMMPFNLFDGGWGSGGLDTVFDSSNFGLNAAVGSSAGDYDIGSGTDTMLDNGINRNDVYRRCGSDLALLARITYVASDLKSGLTQTDIDNLNTALNRDLPRSGKIDPYTGKPDNRAYRGGVFGEYTDGNCKRVTNDTFYPPIAPDPRIGNMTALVNTNPTGQWQLQITDFAPGNGVSLTAFKLIFDFN